MKKFIVAGALIVGMLFVSAPSAHAALTQSEALQIRASANEAKVDLVSISNSYQTYNLLLKKAILELNLVSAQLRQGQISYEQASYNLGNITSEVTSAVVLKNSIEVSLVSLVAKVDQIMVTLNIYSNN